MPTTRAGFAGRVPSINLDQRSAVPCRLIFKLPHQLTPAHVGNRFGKGWVLHHVLDRQALNDDRLVLTDQVRRKLVLMVSSPVGNTRMDLGHTTPLLLAVLRAGLFAGKPSLHTRQLLRIASKILGVRKALLIGGGHHGGESQIDADGLGTQAHGDAVLPDGLSPSLVRRIMVDNPRDTYARLLEPVQ